MLVPQLEKHRFQQLQDLPSLQQERPSLPRSCKILQDHFKNLKEF